MLTFLTSSPSFDWFLLCHYIHFQNYFIKCTSGNHPEIVMFLLKHNVLYKSIDYFRIQGSATVLENTLSKHSELLVCTLLILWVFQETQILPNNSHPPKLGHLVPRPYLEFWNQKYCRTSSKKGKHHFLLITLSFVQINFVLNKIFSCSDDQKVATKLISWILLTLASAVVIDIFEGPRKCPLAHTDPFLMRMRSVASDELHVMIQRRMSQESPAQASEAELVQRLQRLTVLAVNRIIYQGDCYSVLHM